MTFNEAKQLKSQIETEIAGLSAKLAGFPTGAMGLTPDAVKFSPEFRAAKSAFDAAFARLRQFNAFYLKAFRKEVKADRAQRRGA